jgi:hypothetical protein
MAIAESQLLAFGREGITTLLSGRSTSQVGSVRPQSHWKARRTAYLGAKDYRPMSPYFVEILSLIGIYCSHGS